MKKATAWQFAIICGVPFVMVLGNSMLIPVFPQMKQAMNLTQFQVGLLVTFFSVPAGLLIPFAGLLSDQYGRKIIIVPALMLYGIGGLISAFAALLLTNPYAVLIIGRIVQGIGAGGTYQLAMALTGDIFQTNERTKALGLLEAANGLGKVVSPILGSLTAMIIWFAPFFLYSVLAFPISLGLWFLVKEPKGNLTKEPMKEYWKKLKEVFSNKYILLLANYFVGMTALFLLFGILSYVSDILETDYRIFRFLKGIVLAVPVFGMALTSYLSGSILSNKTIFWKPAIVGGMYVGAGLLLLMPLLKNLYLFIGILFVFGICIGAILPPINTLITSAAETNKRGIVTSLYGTVRFFGVAIGPPTFGLVIGFGEGIMFIGAAVISAFAATIGLIFITVDNKPE